MKAWVKSHKILSVIIVLVFLGIVGAASGPQKAPTKPAATVSNSGSTSMSLNQSSNSIPIQTPTPKPAPQPKIYQGSGDDVVDIQKPNDGAAIIEFECTGCDSNTTLKSNGPDSLLVNTIGDYTGSHLIDTSDGANTTELTVTATGSWKITVGDLSLAQQSSGQAISGNGDSVVHLTGSTTKAAVTNGGDENFVVQVYPENGGYGDLPINTIGSYSGRVPLKAPAYIQVTSNGAWSITPQ